MKRLEVEINTENILYNFEKIKEITGFSGNVIPSLKANAYNVGIYNVVKALLNAKVPQKKYFVFALAEAIELRKLFPDLEKIFVLSGIFPGDEEYFKEYDLIPVINSLGQLDTAFKASLSEIILQFDSGMNRSGIPMEDLQKVKDFIENKNMDVFMVMSHLCHADDILAEINQLQINNFKKNS